jgi:SAM-dependent methyltransferase
VVTIAGRLAPRRTSLRGVVEFGASRVLGPLGYELRDKVLSERPEGFAGYLAAALRAGMDVNDYEEQCLGWRLPLPTLQAIVFPRLTPRSVVCELGPGTGRWSRHIIDRIPQGELFLVDPSPWMVRFLTRYFADRRNVIARVNDGQSLPFSGQSSFDLVFSANTFVELTLGTIYLYARDIARLLRPGGWAILDYIDPTTPEGWHHLVTQPPDMAPVYTFHAPEVIDRVFEGNGLRVDHRYQVGKSTFVIAQRA